MQATYCIKISRQDLTQCCPTPPLTQPELQRWSLQPPRPRDRALSPRQTQKRTTQRTKPPRPPPLSRRRSPSPWPRPPHWTATTRRLLVRVITSVQLVKYTEHLLRAFQQEQIKQTFSCDVNAPKTFISHSSAVHSAVGGLAEMNCNKRFKQHPQHNIVSG